MRLVAHRIGQFGRSVPWSRPYVLVVAGLVFAFGLIAKEVLGAKPLAFDQYIMLALRDPANPATPIGPAWLQEAARDITALGSYAVLGIVLLITAGYLLLAHKRSAAWMLVSAIGSGAVLNSLLKFFFARSRPDLVTPSVRVFTASFPSAHATLSAIAYLTFGALLSRTYRSRGMRIYFMSLAVLLTVLVGLSRIYLGVHFPTDILAGWCIGAAWASVCWALMTRLQQGGRIEPPEQP